MHHWLSMNATAFIVPEQSSVTGRQKLSIRPEGVEQHIQCSVVVSADKRRLFDALTLPEYRETWMCFPDDGQDGYTAASCIDNVFRVDRFVKGGLEFTISGAYRTCRRSKMSFTWRKSSATGIHMTAPETVVTIRLQGAFADTTVALDHVGVFSSAEYRWHSALWRRSFEKLRSLF